METLLRDTSLRGKRVFECRNGGYVMFVAAVDFVPDIMMKLARKEIMDGADDSDKICVASKSCGGRSGDEGWGGERKIIKIFVQSLRIFSIY